MQKEKIRGGARQESGKRREYSSKVSWFDLSISVVCSPSLARSLALSSAWAREFDARLLDSGDQSIMSRELDDIDGASSGAGTTSNPFKSLMAASTTTTTSSSFNGSAASTATSSTSPFKTGGGGGFGSISRASGGRFGTITPELFQAMSTGSATSTSSSGSSTSTSTSTPSQRSSTTGQRQTLSPGTAKQDEQQLEREKELLSAYEQVLDTPPTTEAYELLRSLVFVAGIPAVLTRARLRHTHPNDSSLIDDTV